MKVLISGGAGYIGSTICSALEDSNHIPVILDSLITGKKEFVRDRIFYKADISNENILKQIFKEHPDIHYTIHCAALILVPESVKNPYEYYKENVSKSNEFFNQLLKIGCKNIVFSSSASIYDFTPNFMVTETSPLKPVSPYARTKFMMEMILEDYCKANNELKVLTLRYFNPIGADPKLRSGNHSINSSHVLAKLIDTALGNVPEFNITGVDWPTRDGSGIRDYIHVWDLAQAHVKAIENFENVFASKTNNFAIINLGTGRGVTVKELLYAFEKVYGSKIPTKEVQPRPGDVAGAFANADTAYKLLNWQPSLSIEKAIEDALKWTEIQKKLFK